MGEGGQAEQHDCNCINRKYDSALEISFDVRQLAVGHASGITNAGTLRGSDDGRRTTKASDGL